MQAFHTIPPASLWAQDPQENPLPSGMRDVLPPKALRQSRVGGRVMKSFELHGYGRVWLPLFEYARILERTANVVGSALRFVEPESGEVVALRSDMTPQVARVISTRMRSAPHPIRLCYQGSVLRRRQERARIESQVIQAGVELVGSGGAQADEEVLEVLAAAVSSTGLRRVVLDLGHAGIAHSLLRNVPAAAQPSLTEALSAKDGVEVQRRAQAAQMPARETAALVALVELHGGHEVWAEAERVLCGTPAEQPARELRALHETLTARALFPSVVVDLGEVRGFNYYTGPMFQVLAHGPGEPIASGGRYDTLLPRFGLADTQAAGFAVDINNLCWALDTEKVPEGGFPRVVCEVSVPAELRAQLRRSGIVVCSAEDAQAYAQGHSFEFILTSTEIRRADGSAALPLPADDAARVAEITRYCQSGM